jgi:hypothetical protein
MKRRKKETQHLKEKLAQKRKAKAAARRNGNEMAKK